MTFVDDLSINYLGLGDYEIIIARVCCLFGLFSHCTFHGSMSFGIGGLQRAERVMSGSFYLLPAELGRQRHVLAARHDDTPHRTASILVGLAGFDLKRNFTGDEREAWLALE